MAITQELLGVFSKDCNIAQYKGSNRGGSDTIVPMRNRTCPFDLVEKEVDSFRNLTWLRISHMVTRGDSTVRHEEMRMGCVSLEFPSFPSFNGACSISGIMHFKGYSFQQDNGIPMEIRDAAWCFQQHCTWIPGESQDNGYFLPFPHLYGPGWQGSSLQSGI